MHELVGVRVTPWPRREKLPLKVDESRIINVEMRKATSYYHIKDLQDIPSTVIMAMTTRNTNCTDHGNRNSRYGRKGINYGDHRASQVVSKRYSCVMLRKTPINPAIQLKICERIDTWNVWSQYQQGKVLNLIQ